MALSNAFVLGPVLAQSEVEARRSARERDDVHESAAVGEASEVPEVSAAPSAELRRDDAILGSVEALPPADVPQAIATTRDDAVLGNASGAPISLTRAPADPLTVGGQLYLRLQANALEDQQVRDYSFRMPSLLDVFFDVRPNDRVRGFVLGRMTYDPMLPDSPPEPAELGAASLENGAFGYSGVSGTASLSSLLGAQTNAPRVLLDQLWLRFDIGRTLFITAGRQHVRWGTGRFWMPADFLHARRRNPLDVFDARTGTTMLKVHLPIESLAWNLYAYAVTESQSGTPSLSSVAGAARAEFVLGSMELGLGAFLRYQAKPKYAADLSIGLGPIDLYGELAVVDASVIDRVGFVPQAKPPDTSAAKTPEELEQALKQTVARFYPAYHVLDYRPQAVGGFTLTLRYHDHDTFTIGGEYFYNSLGYPSSDFYLGLLLPRPQPLNNPMTFFYLGEHYAAAFATLPAPFDANLHTFTVSTLANLSDRSFITRFDYSLTVLTHLRFELFVAGHYGERSGEFRFGLDLLRIPPALFDVGMAFRLST